MDTIVIATGMPLFLAFLDQHVDQVVKLWETWVETGELVRARHEDPTHDAAIRLRPAAMGAVEFVPNVPGGQLFKDRMLWTLPNLEPLGNSADLPPERSHYWTLQMRGMTARTETLADGRTGLVLGQWELGRL
jgi:hypothetical protein